VSDVTANSAVTAGTPGRDPSVAGRLAAAARAEVLRKPPPAIFGAIDVGTNSTPLGDFRILGRDKEMVRIGRGGFARHVLTEAAMADALATLRRFLKMARLKGVTRLRAVATSAVREARNGGEFVERVRQELGIELHVISAEIEAQLIYTAVRHAVDLGIGDNIIVDIGGGSVEIIIGNAARPELLSSLKLGGSRLAELFLHSDPASEDDLRAMRRHIERQLEPTIARVGQRQFANAIATSGTVHDLCTICAYRRGEIEIEPVTQPALRRDELKSLLAELVETDRQERLKIPGMDARRVDLIIPAVAVLLAAMRGFDASQLRYCDMALREGIILEHIASHRARLLARATWPDPRARSVIHLAERCGYRASHAEQVARLALQLFDQLRPLHELDERYRELLRAACLLHDIGYHIGHQNHQKHSYYLIRNGGLQAYPQEEIEVIANIARYHRKGRPQKSHYSYGNLAKADRPALRPLVAMLRLANALDRTHYSVIASLSVRIRRKDIEIGVRTDKDAELELWTARRQQRSLEKVLNRPVRLVLEPPAENEDGAAAAAVPEPMKGGVT